MLRMNKNKKGQAGFIVTVELLLIVTILVIGLITGFTKLRDNTVAELSDVADAVGALDQSYFFQGLNYTTGQGLVAWTEGSQWGDLIDDGSVAGVGGDERDILYTVPNNESAGTP